MNEENADREHSRMNPEGGEQSARTPDGAAESGNPGDDSPPDDQSGHERQKGRDGHGAHGFAGNEESADSAPRSGYGEQGFGAGESHGGRWGGGSRGGYGGGNPGGAHGTRGSDGAADEERFEQGRGPRSYGPDGWGGGPGPAGPGARSTWGGGGRVRHPGSSRPPGRDQHSDDYDAFQAPWRQSEFAGRGEYGDHDRGAWNEAPGYSSRADIEAGAARADRWRVPGPFSGRGPRDYRRPEAAIRDDVCERLTRHGHLDASGVSVQVDNAEVILEGTVDSRLAKRLAEDVAETVSGVRDVHNRLRIRPSEYDRERTDDRGET
jgi:hypothetical protein